MIKRLSAGVPVLFIPLGGVVLYYLGKTSVPLAIAAAVVAMLIGAGFLVLGNRVMKDHPVLGVYLTLGWTFTLIAVGAAVAALMVVAGLEITDALKNSSGKDTDEGKAIGGLITGALTAFAAALITKDLDEGTGSIWPAAKTKKAFAKKFKGFPGSSLEYAAVHSDRAAGRGHDVVGWDLGARLERAKILAGQ